MDSRSLPTKSPLNYPAEHKLPNSPPPQRFLTAPNYSNTIYSPSTIIRSPIRTTHSTANPINIRIISPKVYQSTNITSPVQTIQLFNSQAFLSPNKMPSLQNPPQNNGLSINMNDNELQQRFLKCVNRSMELLTAYGFAMKEKPDYSKFDINELYEQALRKSQNTLVKYSQSMDNKQQRELIEKENERQSEAQPLFQFQYEETYLYDGEMSQGRRFGYGVVRNEQGEEIYYGEWENDELFGKGKLKNLNANMLEQEFDFKDFNKLKEFWVCYEGDFKGNFFDGMGDLILSNGEKFVGKFERGVVNGEGCFYKNNGEMELGLWENNILVKDL